MILMLPLAALLTCAKRRLVFVYVLWQVFLRFHSMIIINGATIGDLMICQSAGHLKNIFNRLRLQLSVMHRLQLHSLWAFQCRKFPFVSLNIKIYNTK